MPIVVLEEIGVCTHYLNPNEITEEKPANILLVPGLWEEARWVVRLCQQKKSWAPFTMAELAHFCYMSGMKDPDLSRRFLLTPPQEWSELCKAGYLVKHGDEYFPTKSFIDELYIGQAKEALKQNETT